MTTVPAYMAALKTLLEARPGLSGVKVFTAHPGDDVTAECVIFDRVDHEQNWAALGRLQRDETFTVFAVVHIEKAGAGEPIATSVRARAYAIAGEVDEAIRNDPTVTGIVRVSRVAGTPLVQGAGDHKRWAEIEIRIEAQARI